MRARRMGTTRRHVAAIIISTGGEIRGDPPDDNIIEKFVGPCRTYTARAYKRRRRVHVTFPPLSRCIILRRRRRRINAPCARAINGSQPKRVRNIRPGSRPRRRPTCIVVSRVYGPRVAIAGT